MTPITVPGFGRQAVDVTLVVERITHWNDTAVAGAPATQVFFDTGKDLIVGGCAADLASRIKTAGERVRIAGRAIKTGA
jgi:hypothetical protein